MADKHMGVAEAKRRFADVVGEVLHAKRRIVIERRGRPVAAIVPLDEEEQGLSAGKRLAAIIGCGGEEGESFRRLMGQTVAKRRRRPPRHVAELGR